MHRDVIINVNMQRCGGRLLSEKDLIYFFGVPTRLLSHLLLIGNYHSLNNLFRMIFLLLSSVLGADQRLIGNMGGDECCDKMHFVTLKR